MFNDSKSLVLIVHANLMHLVTLLLYCSLRKVLSVARSNNHLCIQNLYIYQLPDESAKRETQYNQESGCVLYFHSNYIINSRLLLLSVFFFLPILLIVNNHSWQRVCWFQSIFFFSSGVGYFPFGKNNKKKRPQAEYNTPVLIHTIQNKSMINVIDYKS